MTTEALAEEAAEALAEEAAEDEWAWQQDRGIYDNDGGVDRLR